MFKTSIPQNSQKSKTHGGKPARQLKYISICQTCSSPRDLLTIKRADGHDIILCTACARAGGVVSHG